VTPSPSQPSINLIILGLRISKYIEAIKENTKPIKRPKKISLLIYLVLKIITLPETKLTKLIK